MIRRAAAFALALAGILGLFRASFADDWARWRGPEGTGISKEASWKPEAVAAAKIKWKAALGEGHSSVAVAAKRVYTMGQQGGNDIVYCFDEESGKELWKYPYSCEAGNYPGPRATPVVDGNLVYTLSRNGDAFGLDAKTGKVVWKANVLAGGGRNITWGLASSPLVVGNLVVYNACSYGVALGKANGQKAWSSPGGACGYASPVLFNLKGRDCLAVFGAKEVTVADLKSGQKLGSFPWVTEFDVNAADPVYFEGKLFITSGYNRGCALLDVAGGLKPLWENKNVRGHFSSPVFLNGHLFAVDGNTGGGQLRCIDPRTGEPKWTQGGGFENLTAAGGKVITIDKGGVLKIVEADPSGYKEVSKATVIPGGGTKWTAPVLANGAIYCRNSGGELVVVDVR
jgi:outer membrane protein assembly factor BamB